MNFWIAFITGLTVGYFVGWAVLSAFIISFKQQANEVEELERIYDR